MTAQYKSEIIFCLVFAAVVTTVFAVVTLDRRNNPVRQYDISNKLN